MDNAGPPLTHRGLWPKRSQSSSKVGTLAEAFPKFFQHTCIRDREPFLVFSKLLHCRCVCRHWQHALNEALPTSRCIGFHPYQANVTGEDVLEALKWMTGANLINQNLKTFDLRECQGIDDTAMEAILSCIQETCTGAQQIDVQGCGCAAVLRAVAARAQTCFRVASPADLFAVLSVDGKCSFLHLLQRLREGPAPHLELDQHFNPNEVSLLTEAQRGSAWTAALLLCMRFDTVDSREERTFDCDATDRDRNTALHFAARRGDRAMISVLMCARANINVSNQKGETPLLVACRAGRFEICTLLIEKGADAKMGNREGETPLLAACRAGHFDMCTLLIEKGADVRAARRDGASPLSMSILSGSTHLVKLFTKSIAGYPSDPSEDNFMQNLAQAHLDVGNLDEWLRGGTSPLALKGHIGALLLLSCIEPAMKEQLRHVRAFLDYNEGLLTKSPSQWPVAHAVLQLASQETDKVFAHAHADMSRATRPRLIHWLNKPTSHLCQFTMRARDAVRGIAFSKCGRKLALATGKEVIVCDAETGFVESTLTGDKKVNCVAFSPDGNTLAAGDGGLFEAGNVRLYDVHTGEVKSTLRGDLPVQSVAFSPDSLRIAAGCGAFDKGEILIFKLQESGDWEMQSECPLSGHDDWVYSVCFSPDGKKIATGSRDRTVQIWDAATGAAVGSPLRGHTADNEQCTCRHYDEDGDEYFELNPDCPVRGHGYVPFPCIECLLL